MYDITYIYRKYTYIGSIYFLDGVSSLVGGGFATAILLAYITDIYIGFYV